jgi:hypothetical protein
MFLYDPPCEAPTGVRWRAPVPAGPSVVSERQRSRTSSVQGRNLPLRGPPARRYVRGRCKNLCALATEPVHHHHSSGAADHARELGDVLVIIVAAWLIVGAPYAANLGVPALADRSELVTVSLFASATAMLLLTALSDWLYIEADQEHLSALVRLPVQLAMKILSATRLGVGLVAAGALGSLGAKLVLGL